MGMAYHVDASVGETKSSTGRMPATANEVHVAPASAERIGSNPDRIATSPDDSRPATERNTAPGKGETLQRDAWAAHGRASERTAAAASNRSIRKV